MDLALWMRFWIRVLLDREGCRFVGVGVFVVILGALLNRGLVFNLLINYGLPVIVIVFVVRFICDGLSLFA